jgi:3-oxoacyl-[acyl-carrier protein] reductase
MDKFLANKVAIVTGGTRGIGRAVAEALLAEGASVAICGMSEPGLRRALEELEPAAAGRVAGRTCDVSKPADVAGFFQFVDRQFGGLDILINNAGVGTFHNVADTPIEEWDRIIGTNLSGAFYCAHEAIPRMRKRGGGFVVNVSSLAGKNAIPGGAAYNASKFGMNGFTEAMMLDHRYENIRTSYVMPGSVTTAFDGQITGADWKSAPEDIAEVVMLLLRMPERTMVSRVEVRPSQPRKR